VFKLPPVSAGGYKRLVRKKRAPMNIDLHLRLLIVLAITLILVFCVLFGTGRRYRK